MSSMKPYSSLDREPHVMHTYGRLPFALSHGRGCRVWDTEGREYLDALAGVGVLTLGHAHPDLVAALTDQISKVVHCSNYYEMPLQEELAAKLVTYSSLTNVFFCNSGLEANEAAIKIARKYGHDRGVATPEIVVFDAAFHGRSIATLSATGNARVQHGFGPLVEGFPRVPLNNIAALRDLAETNPNVVAVFLEVIQGEGGVRTSTIETLRALRALCDAKDWLLMLDEVQCGMGRTGKWFAHQWAGILPDVMPLAKGLGSGVPIGAVVCGPRAANVLGPGNHGSTFGGNPLAMRAGLTTFSIIERDGLLKSAEAVGHWLHAALTRELADVPGIIEVRGQGLMIGIELSRPGAQLWQRAADAGLLISVTAERVVRMLPPLTFTLDDAHELVSKLCPVIKEFLAEPL
jgi:acetylornithine/N-succinyldiaminopimelate aminotransferase